MGNTLENGEASSVGGKSNTVNYANETRVDGMGSRVSNSNTSYVFGSGNTVEFANAALVGGASNIISTLLAGIAAGEKNKITNGQRLIVLGQQNTVGGRDCIVVGTSNEITIGSATSAAFGDSLKRTGSGGGAVPILLVGKSNADNLIINNKSLAFVIGNGGSGGRSTGFAVDYDGNVYCNKVIETGSTNIFEQPAAQSEEPATLSARTITAAADAGISIKLLDHAPTAEDLTGSPCVFLQCEDTAEVEGETTGIFRVTDIFAEK